MQFTKFGQAGLTVSRMILGTGTFGKQTDEKEARRMLDEAAEAGINFIDTGRREECRSRGARSLHYSPPRKAGADGKIACTDRSAQELKNNSPNNTRSPFPVQRRTPTIDSPARK